MAFIQIKIMISAMHLILTVNFPFLDGDTPRRPSYGVYISKLIRLGPAHRGSTDDLLLLQISSGVVWQTRDLHMSPNTLYLLSPRLCFFIVLKRDLFVYRDDSFTS